MCNCIALVARHAAERLRKCLNKGLLLGFALASIFDLRLHSFGNLEFITKIPISVKAGLTGDIINFVIAVVMFFAVGYFVAYFMIGKFRFATPGRLGNYTVDTDNEEVFDKKTSGSNGQPERIIALLGGRENIELVNASANFVYRGRFTEAEQAFLRKL